MNKKKSKKKSFKREALEWGLIIAVAATLYFTGLHTEVIGKLQSVLLATGLIQPSTELTDSAYQKARYDVPLLSLEGEPASLQNFKGKTIFLNFWATWCPPCIAEMPNIQRLYNEMNPDSIAFVMVSLDQDPQKAKAFIDRKDFTFPVYSLGGPKPSVYNTDVVPTTYVISSAGEIVMKHQGMANYHSEEFKTFLKQH